MLYIVCLHHCMYVCYMFIKYQSINQSMTCQQQGINMMSPWIRIIIKLGAGSHRLHLAKK